MHHAMMYLNDVFLVYDIMVFETSIFVRRYENEKPAFSKSPLWTAFLKTCVFGDRFYKIGVDGMGQTEEKKTCGRGLKHACH